MSYRPKIKTDAAGSLTDLALDAETVQGKTLGTSAGNIPVIGNDGKLPDSIMPAIAITDTFVVNSQSAMLALSAEVGDVCVRTDLNKSLILKTAGASTLSHWQELLTPTDAVSSVNGKTGAVTLSASDVGAYPSTNPNGYISGITSSMVTSALGYTPYNSTNPNGYITGITKSMVTTALGYTPGTSNFTGYTSSNKLSTNYIQNDAGWSSFSGYTSSNKLHTDYINNAVGWISGINKSMVTTALGYTPGTSNFSGSYNDLSNKPTIPTADSGLTNDRYVRFDTTSQGLNSTQKSNARTNIGAGTSNFSGDYNDLINKPNGISVEYKTVTFGYNNIQHIFDIQPNQFIVLLGVEIDELDAFFNQNIPVWQFKFHRDANIPTRYYLYLDALDSGGSYVQEIFTEINANYWLITY